MIAYVAVCSLITISMFKFDVSTELERQEIEVGETELMLHTEPPTLRDNFPED